MKKSNKTEKLFSELTEIMSILRSPKGCAWDRKQDHASLVRYLFEEADEVKQAVRKKDWKNLEEELGDILLQVVFHAQIAEEKSLFDIGDIISTLNSKLIRRHPHVFKKGARPKNAKTLTPDEVILQWKQIKRLEKKSSHA